MFPSSSTAVAEFSQTLILPLRLEYRNTLRDDRNDPDLSSGTRLGNLARYIEHAEGSCWKACDDFFQTLALFPENSGPLQTSQADRYSTTVFYHPFIRDLLFGRSKARSVEVLQHSLVRGACIQVMAASPVRQFHVRRAHLFLFPTDILVLAVQLDYVSDPQEALLFPELCDLLNRMRRLYAPYYDNEQQPGECPHLFRWLDVNGDPIGDPSNFHNHQTFFDYVDDKRQPPLAAHWRWLLHPLCSKKVSDVSIDQLLDDRIPGITFVRLHSIRQLSSTDWMKLAWYESSSRSFYSPQFVADELPKHCYNRYWNEDRFSPEHTRFLSAGYSFVIAADRSNGFAEHVLRRHFDRHYFFLGLLVWMHKASLLNYWHRLAGIVHDFASAEAGPASRQKLHDGQKWLLEDISEFITRYYFSEISNQIQPAEIFSWWSRLVGTPQIYDQVIEQTKFLRDVEASHWQERVQNLQNRFQSISAFWFPAALAFGFLGISLGLPKVHPPTGAFAPTWLVVAWWSEIWPALQLAVIVVFFFWLLMWIFQGSTWHSLWRSLKRFCSRVGRKLLCFLQRALKRVHCDDKIR